jgi:ubiquinone/menaquinone biosynthesis C-methylase UbiE/uncharacterized protein YbaR (Trm112 family)
MKDSLLELLRCPRSGGRLHLEAPRREGDEVMDGFVVSASGERYPIENGVPNLVVGLDEKTHRTGEQFAFEFLEVGQPTDRDSKHHRDVTLFMAKTGIDPAFYDLPGLDFRLDQDCRDLGYRPDFSFLEGKVVLDAGCGDGRFARLAAPHAKEMILLDLGEQIHQARRDLQGLGSVHYVRCNLLDIPLAPSAVDFAYSIGVIHHTADLPRAFAEIARCVRPGGRLSLWVYPPEYWGNPAKKAVTLRIRRRLLAMDLPDQVRFIRRFLMPVGRLQLAVARYRPLKYLLAPLFIVNVPRHEDRNEMEATVIDYYLPEYIETLTDADVRSLFETAGLKYERLPFPTSGTGTKAGEGMTA